jgi:hypothetical protein
VEADRPLTLLYLAFISLLYYIHHQAWLIL